MRLAAGGLWSRTPQRLTHAITQCLEFVCLPLLPVGFHQDFRRRKKKRVRLHGSLEVVHSFIYLPGAHPGPSCMLLVYSRVLIERENAFETFSGEKRLLHGEQGLT